MKRSFVGLCMLLAASMWCTAQTPTGTGAPQILFVNQDSVYDIGGLPLGSSMEFHFVIKNVGDATLDITDMKGDSRNIVCDWPKHLKPGKKATINITYNAHGDNGSFKNEVFFTSNATAVPYAYLHLKGAIIPSQDTYTPSSKPSSGKGGKRGH